MINPWWFGSLGWALVLALGMPVAAAAQKSPFAKDNLVAWCIVPFDAKQRGPEERARMLKALGITRFAYDWREKDIPAFDAEIDALERHGIRLEAFWFPIGLEPAKQKHTAIILDLLKRRQIKTQLWLSLSLPREFAALTQAEKVAAASRAVSYVAEEARRTGSLVGLYNHGGWFGEPENQIAIIQSTGLRNVGIVYNFHHAHEHLDRFPELLGKMAPHLIALNLNGMRREGPKILTIGEGDRELEMLKLVSKSGYRGPIGILNHREDVDAEQGLRANLGGIRKLLKDLGDKAALRTY